MNFPQIYRNLAQLWGRRDTSEFRNDVSPKRILVDVSVIAQGDAGTGIQRVVRGLYLQLQASLPSDVKLCPVIASRHRGYRIIADDFLYEDKVALKLESKDVSPRAGDVFLGLDLAAHLLPRHARQIRSWRRHGVKIFLFVYDLLPATEPDWFTPQAGRRFKRWLHFLAIYADGAICISSHVRDMLVTWLDQFAPGASTDLSLSTIRLGADIKETLPSKGVSAELVRLEPRLATMRTILMVGTIEPRKAHSDVLAAFEHIWRTERGTDIGLVMVGRSGWKTEGIQGQIREHLEMGRRLFWLDDASDEELDHLYERCSGVLVASLGEGFGLPLIEAARYGLPILARDIPVFREVAPPWSTFFMGREPMVLADVILSWQENAKAGDRNSYVPPTWEDSRDDLFAALNLDAPARLQ